MEALRSTGVAGAVSANEEGSDGLESVYGYYDVALWAH